MNWPYNLRMESPLGALFLASDGEALTEVSFGAKSLAQRPCGVLLDAQQQLTEYFAGTRKRFDLPLRPVGTPFQLANWQALSEIPYGQTVSYQDIACRLGKPKACRAVGLANHCNPISIIIPCHRVVGKNGSLTGYAGGLNAKRFQLELEHKAMEENRVEI